MFTIGQAVSTGDNDQVKPARKDYVNVKPVRPLCVCVATMLQKTKKQKVCLRNFRIYILDKKMYIHIK